MTLARGGFVNTDNVRAWLNALPNYRQCTDRLIRVDDDGRMSVDVVGAACDVARLHGAPIEVVVTGVGAVFHTDPETMPFFVVSEWLGVDVLGLRVVPAALPQPLRGRVEDAVALSRLLDPEAAWRDSTWGADQRGYDVMDLSDRGVSFPDLADALRVTLRVDEHLVGERATRRAVAS